jgi:NAD(P)-dependent dehydrogenase (short-subunit alcohol dehydrogenase family)
VDVDGLHETENQLLALGAKSRLVVCDVTDESDVSRLVSSTAEEGQIDILANVAGLPDSFAPIGDVTDEAWNRVLAVNLTGVMRLCRATIPWMQRAGHGAIVNVASVAGLDGGAAGVAYTASKHAVIGLTRSVGYLYGPLGIRCNAVCPGAVDTPFIRGAVDYSD